MGGGNEILLPSGVYTVRERYGLGNAGMILFTFPGASQKK